MTGKRQSRAVRKARGKAKARAARKAAADRGFAKGMAQLSRALRRRGK